MEPNSSMWLQTIKRKKC